MNEISPTIVLSGLIVVLICVAGYFIKIRRRRQRIAAGAYDRPTMTAVASGCPVCGAPQSPGMHFCEQCGARLEPPVAPSSCPGCGNRVTPGERFCEQCGTALSR